MFTWQCIHRHLCLVLCDIYHVFDNLLVPKMHPVKTSL